MEREAVSPPVGDQGVLNGAGDWSRLNQAAHLTMHGSTSTMSVRISRKHGVPEVDIA